MNKCDVISDKTRPKQSLFEVCFSFPKRLERLPLARGDYDVETAPVQFIKVRGRIHKEFYLTTRSTPKSH